MNIKKSYKGIDLGKSDEIKILTTLRDAFQGTGHYLEGLFSREMVSHCSQLIHDDFLPDIFSEMANNGSRVLDLEYQLHQERSRSEMLATQIKSLNNTMISQNREKNREISRLAEGAVILKNLVDAINQAREFCEE
jgi:hypothetical protein